MREMARSHIRSDDPVTSVPLIGVSYGKKLEKLSVFTVSDLLFHFPSRYEDTRDISMIAALQPEQPATIEAIVRSIANTRTRRGMWLTRALIEDSSGSIAAVWFNQPFLTKAIHKGDTFLFNGKISTKWGSRSLSNPQYEKVLEGQTDHTHLGKLSPRYPETYGVSSKWIRARLKYLKPFIRTIIQDYIPASIRAEESLLDLATAIEYLHYPESEDNIKDGSSRIGMDELITIQRQALAALKERTRKTASVHISSSISPSSESLLQHLPFNLTRPQENALQEILADLASPAPMYRLLNGDVGSGKTIVALLAALAMYDAGSTTVIMAPTTILAQQHFTTITTLLQNASLKIPVTISTSLHTKTDLAEPHITVGTHALLHRGPLPENTGFIIVDEQHRFGVSQRDVLKSLAIQDKPDALPHYLTMTATPIPRTLTMALYGSTQVSILDEMPPGRIPVQTFLVAEDKREDAYNWIRAHISSGEQAFILCPLIDESEVLTAKSAKETYENLSAKIFPDIPVGLVHGQLKEQEKQERLEAFRTGDTKILVATPVIEVGIDIPNSTIMIIENAERFGLAQLHQLRGRIGRGTTQSYCLLFTEQPSESAERRLRYFSSHRSGFDVAAYDLKERGPGEVYGTRQSGILNLRFADITDARCIKKAERIARALDLDLS